MAYLFLIATSCTLALAACAVDSNNRTTTTTTTTPPPKNPTVKKEVAADMKPSASQMHGGGYSHNEFGGVDLGAGMGASNFLGGGSGGYGKAFIIPVFNYGAGGLGYGLYGKGYGTPYGYSNIALGGHHPYGSSYYSYPYGSSYYHGPQGLSGHYRNNY